MDFGWPVGEAETPEARAAREQAEQLKQDQRQLAWKPFCDVINSIAENMEVFNVEGSGITAAMPHARNDQKYGGYYQLTVGGSSNPGASVSRKQQRAWGRAVRRMLRPTLLDALSGSRPVPVDTVLRAAGGPPSFGTAVDEIRVVQQTDGTVLGIRLRGEYSSRGPTFPPEFHAYAPDERTVLPTPEALRTWLVGQLKGIGARPISPPTLA